VSVVIYGDDLCRVAEPEPAGAETFGRSRSWSWSRNKVSAPALGETKSKRLFRQYGSGGQVTFKK
jgi:hypothetical protein